jgi:predicted porin
MLKYLAVTFVITSALAGAAQAQSASTKDGDSSPPSCFDSLWDYLNSSVKKCPLSVGPFTVYGTIDVAGGYQEWGAPLGQNTDKTNYGIQRNSRESLWLFSPNGLSTSTIGVKFSQEFAKDWEALGVVDAGWNPLSFRLINGPQSLADNNNKTLENQNTAFDSARAGQWYNGQGFFGVSNPTYGTLTFGRIQLLSVQALSAYDPVASVAFSQIGFSTGYSAYGATTTSRINTAVTYRLTYQDIRFAAQGQVGGYDEGNAATNQWQAQLGMDIDKFSFDMIGGWAQNAVTYSSFNGSIPAALADFAPNSILRATAGDHSGISFLARYQWDKWRFFAGDIMARTTNPSDPNIGINELNSIADGIFIPASVVNTTNFTIPRFQNTAWGGVRYVLRDDLHLASGIYWETQNNFSPETCTGQGVTTSSRRCAGGRYSYSFLAQYRPVPRVTVYGGLMVSTVYGGPASGYLHDQNVDPTVGIRFQF